jgi:hypothetical protein
MDYLRALVTNIHGFYFTVSLTLLILLGVPWLLLRKKIKSPDRRRIISTLIFSVAFTPGIFGGDKGGFTAPVVYLLPCYQHPFWILSGIGSIILVWGISLLLTTILHQMAGRHRN